MIRIFSIEALQTGWSIWWRAWLRFAGGVVVLLGVAFVLTRGQPQSHSEFSLLAALAPLLAILGLNVGLIFWLDGSSKQVALKKYKVRIDKFVGWTVFYRSWLMTLALGLPTVFALSFLGLLLTSGSPDSNPLVMGILESISIVLRLVILIGACGWAFGKVLKNTSEAETATTH